MRAWMLFLWFLLTGSPALIGDSAPPDAPARAVSFPTGKYPDSLINTLAKGFVSIYVMLDANGRVVGTRVLRATHPDFVGPALDGLETWKFEPARSGGRPVPSAGVQNLWFDARSNFSSIGSYNFGLKAVMPGKVPKEFRYDQEPDVLTVVNPIYPYDLILAGTTGSARVELTVNIDGVVDSVQVTEATHPEFGKALRAMAYACLINPARKRGVPLAKSFLWRQQRFAPGMNHLTYDQQTTEIIQVLRSKPTELIDGSKLPKAPLPRYQPGPAYPIELQAKGVPGEAEIEFVIDRQGRAQLPRIVAATHEDFGWAAATAVQQWLYEPVVMDGAPGLVRMKVVIEFKPLPGRVGRGR